MVQPDGAFVEVKEGGEKRTLPQDKARVAASGVRKQRSHGASIVRHTRSAIKSLLEAV